MENLTVVAIKKYSRYKFHYIGTINEEHTLIKGHWGLHKGEKKINLNLLKLPLNKNEIHSDLIDDADLIFSYISFTSPSQIN